MINIGGKACRLSTASALTYLSRYSATCSGAFSLAVKHLETYSAVELAMHTEIVAQLPSVEVVTDVSYQIFPFSPDIIMFIKVALIFHLT